MMNLYLIERTDDCWDYDIFDSFICAAHSPEEALLFHPVPGYLITDLDGLNDRNYLDSWVTDTSLLKCTKIGTSDSIVKPGVVLTSYNAG